MGFSHEHLTPSARHGGCMCSHHPQGFAAQWEPDVGQRSDYDNRVSTTVYILVTRPTDESQRLTSMQINCPQPDTWAEASAYASVGRKACRCVTGLTSSKKSHFPLSCFPERRLLLTYNWLFRCVLSWGFHGRKIRRGRQ